VCRMKVKSLKLGRSGICKCSSQTSAAATCKHSRPKQGERKDQAKRHLKVPSMHMKVKALFGRIVWCAEGTNKCLSSAIEVSAFKPALKVCEPNWAEMSGWPKGLVFRNTRISPKVSLHKRTEKLMF